MNMRWLVGALIGATLVLALAACGGGALTPRGVESSEPGDTTVDFYRDDEAVGRLFVRVHSVVDGQVRFLIEVPYIAVRDYRLDDIALTFESSSVDPLMMLDASSGDLTKNINFSRVAAGEVRLSIVDTGESGDYTVQLRFLADANSFADEGLRMHAELGFNAGDAVVDMVLQPAP